MTYPLSVTQDVTSTKKMYGLFKLSNRLIDGLTGFQIDSALKNSLEFDFWERDRIDQYHREKFEILSEIAGKAAYYKPYGGLPLSEYPLISKPDFASRYPELITHHVKPFHSRRSTGSSGVTVTHNVTREMLLAKRVSHQKMLKWYGLSRESAEMKIGGTKSNFTTDLYYLARNKRYVNSYQISQKDITDIIVKYNRFRPEVLYGYPSVLSEFIIKARQAGTELHEPVLIVVQAENLYADMVQRFRDSFPGAKLANQYWSTEAPIAETCPHGSLHLAEDTIICEVHNKDKEGAGDIYITNLFSFAVPYIRYQLGDRIKLSERACSCGRNTRVIESMQGRDIELLVLPDGRELPITSLHYHNYSENMLSHQLIYFKKEKKVRIKFVPVNKSHPIMEKEMQDYWKDHFGLKVEFERVNNLEHSPGGKLKRLINVEDS